MAYSRFSSKNSSVQRIVSMAVGLLSSKTKIRRYRKLKLYLELKGNTDSGVYSVALFAICQIH